MNVVLSPTPFLQRDPTIDNDQQLTSTDHSRMIIRARSMACRRLDIKQVHALLCDSQQVLHHTVLTFNYLLTLEFNTRISRHSFIFETYRHVSLSQRRRRRSIPLSVQHSSHDSVTTTRSNPDPSRLCQRRYRSTKRPRPYSRA
jgi:hypothetical protein